MLTGMVTLYLIRQCCVPSYCVLTLGPCTASGATVGPVKPPTGDRLQSGIETSFLKIL